ncbi:unnamed protein product [Moneuplotes crassus]|uniref:Uncharacterized protein n=1 Tax=Euplotes crassus TaxID=5936 RepID=A0AAD1YAR1_EUPCR|nr:unnamed protein product [Moneuplotes crassus]
MEENPCFVEYFRCVVCSKIFDGSEGRKFPFQCGLCMRFLCCNDQEHTSQEHFDKDAGKCEAESILEDLIDVQEDTVAQEELLQQKYRCGNKNCTQNNMGYEEALMHIGICTEKSQESKLKTLLNQLNSKDEPIVWDASSRCKRCQCIPFQPIYFCKCGVGLYCHFCRAQDEKCLTCNTIIRSVGFMDPERFYNRIFNLQIKRYLCRFCAEPYTWDALAIHERICFEIATESKLEEIENPEIKSHYLLKEEYLSEMKTIFCDVQEKLSERLDQFKTELIRFQQRNCEQEGKKLEKKRIIGIEKYIAKLKDEDKVRLSIQELCELVQSFPKKLEPPSQDQNMFVKFRKFDKSFTYFQFKKNIVNPGEQRKLAKASRPLIQSDGFKIIQTPLSNRVFLVGGDSNPWGTFEFDLENRKFLPEGELKNEQELEVPLSIGRSHHSLVATCGLIFCTGGKPNFLRRRGEGEDETDEANGRLIEVFKLKEGRWIEYNNRLQNSRCCHSSCILGSYLYLFQGYDVSGYAVNSVSIERIKIDTNEATLFSDPGYDSFYVNQDDNLGENIRSFTSIFPTQSLNQIIYFGYTGLEEDACQPLDQKDLIRTDEDNQIYHRYSFRDEYPRYNESKLQLDWEREEYQEALNQIRDRVQECEEIQTVKNPLCEDYIHHPMYFRGITFYHSSIEKLCYFDDEEAYQVREVLPPEQDVGSDSSSDSDF